MIDIVFVRLRRNAKAAVNLLPFIILASLMSLMLVQEEDIVSASHLFQSPVSPVQEPIQQSQPTPEKVLPPTVPPPPPTSTPVIPQEIPSPTPVLIETQPQQPPQPVEQPVQEVEPTIPPPQVVEVPNPVQPMPATTSQSEVVIDSGLLIDSILVYIAYAWLCCGVLVFVMIPILFLVMYVWGTQRAKNNS